MLHPRDFPYVGFPGSGVYHTRSGLHLATCGRQVGVYFDDHSLITLVYREPPEGRRLCLNCIDRAAIFLALRRAYG